MMRRFQPQNRLFFGRGAGLLLLFAGCAWMPPGGEHAEFMEPPPMERTLSQASRQEPVAPCSCLNPTRRLRRVRVYRTTAGPMSLRDEHRTLGEVLDASPGGSIDNAGIFNVKLAEAMEFAL
jgi:hypothetical protein